MDKRFICDRMTMSNPAEGRSKESRQIQVLARRERPCVGTRIQESAMKSGPIPVAGFGLTEAGFEGAQGAPPRDARILDFPSILHARFQFASNVWGLRATFARSKTTLPKLAIAGTRE